MINRNVFFDKEKIASEVKALDRDAQAEVLLSALERAGGEKATPEELVRATAGVLSGTNPADLGDAWLDAVYAEKKKLEDVYTTTKDKEAAVRAIAEDRVNQFGDTPLTTVKYQTNRDIYNALKEVYDKSGGDWELVGKVAEYNDIPEDLMREFVKDGKWTDYKEGGEAAYKLMRGDLAGAAKDFFYTTPMSEIGAIGRGLTGGMYGGLANILTGGDYSNMIRVPEGLETEDMAKTLWRAGIRQSDAYGRSLLETDPAMEIAGNLAGAALPLGAISKATKGVKAAADASRWAKIGMQAARGAATGALYSIPEALTKESVPEFSQTVAKNAALFGAFDGLLAGVGEGAGALRRGVWNTMERSVKPGENLTKSFSKLKPVVEMSEAEKARGLKAGWLKEDGSLNVTDYLAREHGMDATQTIDDLATVSKTNREVYNKLRDEVKDFNYKQALDKAAEDAIIPNAPLSRVNRLLKSLPEKLEKFSDDIIGYTEDEGVNLAQSMRAFNQQVKHELRAIRNPSTVEKRAIDQYLKDVETANMKQYMKKKLPSELKAVDKAKTMYSELARIFQITNPISALRATGNVMEDQVQRNYIRQLISGEEYRPGTVRRLLERVGRAPSIDKEKLYNAQQFINAGISKSTKGDK